MTRRHVTFTCEGAMLVGTIDEPVAGSLDEAIDTGLLLVSGGNEIRSGAWGGQAQLASRLAAEGFPVFRFDRRGIGDSEGPNGGFLSSAPDIQAAIAAFRMVCPSLRRIVGFGNCDAASALMLARGADAAYYEAYGALDAKGREQAPAPAAPPEKNLQKTAGTVEPNGAEPH